MLREQIKFIPVKTTGNLVMSKSTAVLQTNTEISFHDRLGGLRVRWDIGRNDYRVESGLYACGNPDTASPVLVTANYKLTFDSVRKELFGMDVWILVLDTKGVNVWCAAGKGTFGTDELLRKIKDTDLARIVTHRDLILPQLGASGVSAWKVTEASGFRVHFGPVYARDLSEYLKEGMKKTETMSRVTFNLGERMAVAPVEVAHAWKALLLTIPIAVLLSLPTGTGFSSRVFFYLLSLTGGIFAGTILFPALLPFLPFRAFSVKGAVLGFLWTALSAFVAFFPAIFSGGASLPVSPSLPADFILLALSGAFLTIPLVSFLSMNFTGASTFTCQTGAELEVKIGLPVMIGMVAAGIIFGVLKLIM